MLLFWLGVIGGAVLVGVALWHLVMPRACDYGDALETIDNQEQRICELEAELEELKRKAHW